VRVDAEFLAHVQAQRVGWPPGDLPGHLRRDFRCHAADPVHRGQFGLFADGVVLELVPLFRDLGADQLVL
jgi:hypothetical protein